MFRQDWEPVVFTKKKVEKGSSIPRGPTHAQKLDENTENYKDHKKIDKKLADAIRKKRIELKLTQEQLAQKVNVRAGIVNDIESQRCIYDSVTVEKIKRVLGITNKSIVKN